MSNTKPIQNAQNLKQDGIHCLTRLKVYIITTQPVKAVAGTVFIIASENHCGERDLKIVTERKRYRTYQSVSQHSSSIDASATECSRTKGSAIQQHRSQPRYGIPVYVHCFS